MDRENHVKPRRDAPVDMSLHGLCALTDFQTSRAKAGRIQPCLAKLIVKPLDGRSSGGVERMRHDGWTRTEQVDREPFEPRHEEPEEPIAAIVGVAARIRAQKVAQHAFDGSARGHGVAA